MTLPIHRLHVVTSIFNICCLLKYEISTKILINPIIKRGIDKRNYGVTIDFNSLETITKKVPNTHPNFENCVSAWKFVKEHEYHGLIKVTSANVISSNFRENSKYQGKTLKIIMKRAENVLPLNQSELLKALKNILEGLDILHTNDYVHTDIRWPNIMFHYYNYQLIDFDNVIKLNSTINELYEHYPDYLKKGHVYTVKEDLWQVGNLIGKLNIDFSNDVVNLSESLRNKQYNSALEVLKIIDEIINTKHN